MSSQPVIVITGASSGIGEASARLFAGKGYRVVLAARRKERLEALAASIEEQGGSALAVPTDVTKLDEVQNLVARTLETFRQIDVLLNNAGFGRLRWLEELHPQKDVEAQIKVNLVGLVWMAQAVLPHMIQWRKGHIVNMSSVAGWVGTPTYTVYAATKFAVRGFTEALRREVGVYGVRVSAIYPGGVATEFKLHTGADRKTGVTTPEAIRLSADDVAQAVWKIVQRPQRGLIIPWPLRLGVWLNVHFQGLADWMIERRFTRPERGM